MFNKHKLEFGLFLLFGKLLSIFGINSVKKTSKILAFCFFHVIKIRKKIVSKNLSSAFPHLNNNEINKLAYENYVSVAITFLEIFLLPSLTPQKIKAHFNFTNLKIVKNKLQEEKGLILLTAHFGNWELAAIAVGLHLNEKINVLVKPQKNPYVSKWLNSMRQKFGNSEISLGVSVKEIFNALNSNEIVGVVGDQRGPKTGIKVKYFDKETYTFIGTAAIALKTKCPVLVLLSTRNSEGNYDIKIEEIEIQKFNGSNEEQIIQFNQKYMNILENYVKQYPEQWFWMHNIWKY